MRDLSPPAAAAQQTHAQQSCWAGTSLLLPTVSHTGQADHDMLLRLPPQTTTHPMHMASHTCVYMYHVCVQHLFSATYTATACSSLCTPGQWLSGWPHTVVMPQVHQGLGSKRCWWILPSFLPTTLKAMPGITWEPFPGMRLAAQRADHLGEVYSTAPRTTHCACHLCAAPCGKHSQ
jgi:hypothetical protein